MTNHELTEHLYSALNSKIGIVLTTDDPERLRQRLYAQRRRLEDSDLNSLIIRPSPQLPQSELWIHKNDLRKEDIESTGG